jgi:hypothetical protein
MSPGHAPVPRPVAVGRGHGCADQPPIGADPLALHSA